MKKIAVIALILAVALTFAITPAFARGRRGGSDITVSNSNTCTTVTNNVEVSANTGDNDADGDEGGNGGDSGDAMAGGFFSSAETGDGGNGGDGGDGGIIVTGDATAGAVVVNAVNTNRTHIRSGCSGCDGGDITVRNRNRRTIVTNNVEVEAETGDNDADGDEGGNGGDSGDATNFCGGNATTGDGGDGGDGGWGGEIRTGDADAGAAVINVVNRNVTRISRRGGSRPR